MRRLNVRFAQLEQCIRTRSFALTTLPRNPELIPGELLLLQLTKDDAEKFNRLDRRVEFALVFDRVEPDPTGAISRARWPDEGREWRYIIECAGHVTTVPFSLERLGLSRDYAGQSNAVWIDPADEALIAPLVEGATLPMDLTRVAGVRPLLQQIRNHDIAARWTPPRVGVVREHPRVVRDPWLPNALKAFYDHKCQICVHDFRPRWSVPYADTRLLTPIGRDDVVESRNLAVLCPNHNAIIGAASATYDSDQIAFRFPNGLIEKLVLRDHLL